MPLLTVDQNEAGQRLDRFLRKILRNMPTSHIYKLLRTRKVRVNGKKVPPEHLLVAGDKIILHMDENQFRQDARRQSPEATGLEFRVVFEDEFLLVVSKPPFLPVHPGAGHRSNSLIDQVHAYLEVDDQPTAFRPSLAHRLDRDTSGLLLVGKSIAVLRKLNRMIQEGKVSKSYLALAQGVPQPRSGVWELPIRRRDIPGSGKPPEGRPGRRGGAGRTAYRVAAVRKLQRPKGAPIPVSLLLLQLLTGRTHQIRSHLLQMGHPLAGDARYGDRELNRLLWGRYGLRRQFLHAYLLRLDHPATDKPLQWTDSYPDDLLPIARSLRLRIPPA